MTVLASRKPWRGRLSRRVAKNAGPAAEDLGYTVYRPSGLSGNVLSDIDGGNALESDSGDEPTLDASSFSYDAVYFDGTESDHVDEQNIILASSYAVFYFVGRLAELGGFVGNATIGTSTSFVILSTSAGPVLESFPGSSGAAPSVSVALDADGIFIAKWNDVDDLVTVRAIQGASDEADTVSRSVVWAGSETLVIGSNSRSATASTECAMYEAGFRLSSSDINIDELVDALSSHYPAI